MSTYFFQLGNTPELSTLELEQVFARKLKLVADDMFAMMTTPEPIDPKTAQDKLGGTVKILEQVSQLHTRTQQEIEDRIEHYLTQQAEKLQFAVSTFGDNSLTQLDETQIKQHLQQAGVKSRYRTGGAEGLSAAVLLNTDDMYELYVINTGNQLVLARTVTVQDIDDWTKRDRQKPYADHKKGLLPPKVARMMVNIGLGYLETGSSTPTLYDPFCGSGTILMEGLMRGCDVQGSDLDQDAVAGTEENLQWLTQEYHLQQNFGVVQRDATQDFSAHTRPWADVIATEPFLGKLTPKEQELPNIYHGLYNMYLGALKSWQAVLRPQAPLVLIIPRVEATNRVYHLQKLIDKLESLGYTTVSESVIYSRPQAIVQREIHFLRYTGA